MRIAIDISQIIYEGTGVANYTREVVRSILEFDNYNKYILFGLSLRKKDVLDNYFNELKGSHNNVEAKFFQFPQTLATKVWNDIHTIKIERLIGDIDIFHSSDWIQPPTKAKKITTVHDMVVYLFPQYSHPSIVTNQKKRLKWVKKECDQVITDSYATRDDLVNVTHMDISKISVAYPGIDPVFSKRKAEEVNKVKSKYGVKNDYILAVGTKEPRKNLKTLVEAYQRYLSHPLVTSRNKKIELVLVGKSGWGEILPDISLVRELGYIKQEDLPALYSGATLFAYPSFYEGFGFPILEAMACGCPVITSNRGSLREVAGDAAIIVDPSDANDLATKMTQICFDDVNRNISIKRGFENIKKYTWSSTAKNVVSFYEKLLHH